MSRKLPAAAYLLALICFLLPFVEISCNNQKVLSLTGVQLLGGTQLPGSGGPFGGPAQRIKPDDSVVLAFIAGVAALVLSLLNQRRTDIGAGACGIVGAGSLLALQHSIVAGAPPQAMGLIQVQYQAGYFLSLLAFLAGAALSLYLAFVQRLAAAVVTASPASSPPVLPPAPPLVSQANAAYAAEAPVASVPQTSPAPRPHFCTRCGRPIAGDARFCPGCGTAQA